MAMNHQPQTPRAVVRRLMQVLCSMGPGYRSEFDPALPLSACCGDFHAVLHGYRAPEEASPENGQWVSCTTVVCLGCGGIVERAKRAPHAGISRPAGTVQ